MVCKEEVLSWFKDLDSYKRIDVLYNLLIMCLPFELRFLGTCVEEIGKHTYQELRGPAISANDVEKLTKDETLSQGLSEESTRHRVLLYISLLSSKNYSVANLLYKKLLRTEYIEELVKGNVKDEQSEFLLIFTMALYHPAFTFDQKQFFGSILTRLIDLSESSNRISPKPSVGYPPGFGYPNMNHFNSEITSIPVKCAPTMTYNDPTLHQQPPGLTQIPLVTAPIEYMNHFWTRSPAFPSGGPPETPPFPARPISPLVSQQCSPSHSRSTSPHRTQMPLRAPPQQHPPPHVQPPTGAPPVECIPTSLPLQPVPLEPLPQSSLPIVFSPEIKLTEDEFPPLQEEKPIREHMWPNQPFITEIKSNGMRFPPHFVGKMRPLMDQMNSLNIVDGDNSLHQSNSSSNSSPNQSPPDTPSNTPSVTPHGPGRGSEKQRNGMPPYGGPVMCDTASPPPPNFNCPVPYSYHQFPPTRSIFHYNHHPFRPPFTGPYPTYPTDSFPMPTYPYVPLMYSSPYPPRTPTGCYNCGNPGHIGSECSVQNIEDITQKKSYQIDFAPTLPPDTDK